MTPRSSLTREVWAALRPILLSYASVVFASHPATGALLLLATLGAPARGVAGLLAVAVANLAARVAGYPASSVRTGHYGYNALLVGLSLAHTDSFNVKVLCLVIGGALLAVLLTAALGDVLGRLGLPILALPFVLVSSLVAHTTLEPPLNPAWLSGSLDSPVFATEEAGRLLLQSVGALVFQPTDWAGALVLLAAGVYSRITAVALALGAALGLCVSRGLGIHDPAILIPACYNSALSAAAFAGVFFLPGRAAWAAAALAASLAAWLSFALLAPFAPVSLPILAWPFVGLCLVGLCAAKLRAPGSAPFPTPLPGRSPEENLEYVSVYRTRLNLPGPPRFCVPVAGAWTVTQGFDGEITHRGDWKHALDFEIFDHEGFPFRSNGAELDDFFCYGQPVLAPGFGTVAALHDGVPDNRPGEQDLRRPWGNAVVLHHGASLYTVLAHLRPGSLRVALGQSVVPGQMLAECGSSGRSPRPHLHFQAQATPWLGAATLPFALLNFASGQRDALRFERVGVPARGACVRVLKPDSRLLGPNRGFPGQELCLRTARGESVRLRREVSTFGELALLDVECAERLYFVAHEAGVLFTALRGRTSGVLGALLLTVPSLPAVSAGRLSWSEILDPASLLPSPLRVVYELLRSLGDPLSAHVDVESERGADLLVCTSVSELRLFGLCVRRWRGRAELDADGLRSLSLRGGPRTWPSFFQANRSHSPIDDAPLMKAQGPSSCLPSY
jgi:urea transporter